MGDYDDIEAELDRRSFEQTARVRAFLKDAGRPDLVVDLDAKLRDVRLGIAGAQGCWHALSETQRRILRAMGRGAVAFRSCRSDNVFDVLGADDAEVCRLPTIRNLCARGLCHPDGDTFDVEKRIVITERGRFVLEHGPTSPPRPPSPSV